MEGHIRPYKGKEFVRRSFVKSPDSGSYLIPNEVGLWKLLDFYREARASGFTVIARHMHEYGLKGFVAVATGHDKGRTSGPLSYELYFAGVPTHGRKLDPDEQVVDPAEWDSVLKEHEGHDGFMIDMDASRKGELRMVCYCRAGDGISVVRRVGEVDLAEMEEQADMVVDSIMGDTTA